MNKDFISTYIFIDLESTGLVSPKITEFAAFAISSKNLRSVNLEFWNRVSSKLSFCVNPNKEFNETAEKLTKLNNDILSDSRIFSNVQANMIKDFINFQTSPVCLVAHNGYRFDFMLLKTELSNTDINLDDNLWCLDSLPIFEMIRNNANYLPLCTKIKSFVSESKHDEVEYFGKDFGEPNIKKMRTKRRMNNNNLENCHNYISPFESVKKLWDSRRKTRKSCKLQDLYEFYVTSEFHNEHYAESDAIALSLIIHRTGNEFWDKVPQTVRTWGEIEVNKL